MKTLLITDSDMAPAAEIIRGGGLVAVPTETVYGLAANGLDGAAVQRIYDVKNRPETKPISLLVTGMADVEKFCADIPDAAYALAGRFWPGPLTMVLKKRDNVPDIVTAGGATVGVRCPDHQKTLELIRLAGVPLAAPSANLSGAPSPKNVDDVLKVFNGKIACAVDGGQCTVGIESTIVDLADGPPKILRQGGLARAAIEAALSARPEG
ncbi:tRNA threonylcarbamoyl adenosine modification protein, Sua5/YciO/YrdC/YwlC family [Sporobacter termitidis DSM 10068]|uniref:L-threonylcarbamoyladenylate synthase n=1 Tax=Sporobacter termitidis DSM 10068 TaxID=1123282 RepID=A0A1M5WU03_9FIRM|nr:L-threonylcarbamoyladenylate synthase [Sporobacter termitidis]SHH91069.1 tRNA threonylcarbamoyl adenosine modification protein, Sua5/YciO/YrdC/YwlC family [Sporobacter termitidis DSM 10068]